MRNEQNLVVIFDDYFLNIDTFGHMTKPRVSIVDIKFLCKNYFTFIFVAKMLLKSIT